MFLKSIIIIIIIFIILYSGQRPVESNQYKLAKKNKRSLSRCLSQPGVLSNVDGIHALEIFAFKWITKHENEELNRTHML